MEEKWSMKTRFLIIDSDHYDHLDGQTIVTGEVDKT